MNTAEYLVKKLEEIGITDFFGLPGDYNFNILYAIEDNPNTKWIGCTNELNAGYAADGYARVKGFGAIVTTFGVGELSALNAIAGSCSENVPVINIVGVPTTKNIEEKTLLHHNLQEANYEVYMEAYKPFVEAYAFLNRDNAKIEIDRVLKAFVMNRKPVYIAIPIDIATMDISNKEVDYSWESDEETLEKVIVRINNKLKNSKKPVILADVLAKRFDAKFELREFVEKSGIPTTSFMMGAGLIPSDTKNYLGMYYGEFKNEPARKALETTDCLIAIGPVYSDLNSFGFNLSYKINSHIAIYGTYTYIDGIKHDNVKMTDVLAGLSKIVDNCNFEIEKEDIGYEKSSLLDGKLTSEYIYPRMQEYLRENDIIFGETGIIPHGLCQMKLPENVDMHTQTLWGSIGWATPASFGASIAKPNSRVILFTGEGSHQVTAMEFGSMLRYGVKPVVIVLNNEGYTIERILSKDSEDDFNNIMKMNYSKFARAFEGDIWATKVETAEDFDKALKVTQIMKKLCYLEICTDKMDVPVLTQKVISKFVENTKKASEDFNKKIIKKDDTVFLDKPSSFNFGTKVHESLRD